MISVFNRDSIIHVAGGSTAEPDYNNLKISPAVLAASDEERDPLATVAGQEEALYTNPEDVIPALNLEVKGDQRQVNGILGDEYLCDFISQAEYMVIHATTGTKPLIKICQTSC